jgi:serine/threonine-protein kinase
MGEVYRARDTRLNRDVAIKTLPAHVAFDRERAERFDREAKLLAALNHPHIAGIHGLEQSGGTVCLVLELVDGQSLAERISGAPLPISEALRIARQIADALLAAHDKGIIHRDLKPANVMLTADGQVKVLDFGLGKAVEADPAKDVSNSPTMTLGATQVGMLLGTAGYMSPEQAKGQTADKRSDVWAFGCVLYEMLTGTRAFQGDDVSETLAAVLKSEPAWAALPADVSPAVRALLEGCLEKTRRSRLADLSAAMFVIDRHQNLSGVSRAAIDSPAIVPRAPLWRRATPMVATAAVVAAVVSAAWWLARPKAAPPLTTRFTFPLTEAQALASSARRSIGVSPDGTQFVFGTGNQLYLRRMGDFAAQPIPGSEGIATSPVYSPDGRNLAFWVSVERVIKSLPSEGGTASPIRPSPAPPTGMRWTEQGLLVALGPGGIIRISGRGVVEQLVKVEVTESAIDPQVLPDGRHVLFTLGGDSSTVQDTFDKAQVVVQPIASGVRTVVRSGAGGARYLPTGHLLYAVGGTLFAAPFDLGTLKETGPSVPVIEGVRRGVTGVVHYDVSHTGTLVYVPGSAATALSPGGLAFADRSGTVQDIKIPPGGYNFPRASKDGKSIAFEVAQGNDSSVWVYALGAGTAARRLTMTGRNRYPVWLPDSQRLAFQSDRDGDPAIFVQRADGTGPVTRITKPEAGVAHIPESWSPDGAHLLYSAVKGADVTLWVLSVKEGRAEPFGGIKATRPIAAEFSPDGKWIAYSSDIGRSESFVYLQPFPATGEMHQVSKDGENGHHPMWTPKGDELLYIPQVGRLVSVNISTKPTVAFSESKPVPRRFTLSSPVSPRPWDIAPDGRILSVYEGIQTGVPEIRVILNWFEELKARVPVK